MGRSLQASAGGEWSVPRAPWHSSWMTALVAVSRWLTAPVQGRTPLPSSAPAFSLDRLLHLSRLGARGRGRRQTSGPALTRADPARTTSSAAPSRKSFLSALDRRTTGPTRLKSSLSGAWVCTKPCTVDNTEWSFNATSGALTSLYKPPCLAGGWCLTDAGAPPGLPEPELPTRTTV